MKCVKGNEISKFDQLKLVQLSFAKMNVSAVPVYVRVVRVFITLSWSFDRLGQVLLLQKILIQEISKNWYFYQELKFIDNITLQL